MVGGRTFEAPIGSKSGGGGAGRGWGARPPEAPRFELR